MKKTFLLLCLLSVAMSGFGQPYGNEWINFNQSYFKFKVGEEGFYRITSDDLADAGFPVNDVPASRIRLYRRGEEQAIRVNSTAGVVSSIDFYGRTNDGTDDLELYGDIADQLHPSFSLFADSAAYFLTYSLNNTSGLRMTSYTEANSQGLPAETSFEGVQEVLFNDAYSVGRRFGSDGSILSSSYERAEGWMASPVRTNVALDVTFNLGAVDRSSTTPVINLTLVGANNNLHLASLLAGPDVDNLREINELAFTGYEFRRQPLTLSWDDVAADGTVVVRLVPSATNDRLSWSNAQITYNSTFDLGGNGDLIMTLPVNGGNKSFIRVNDPTADAELLDVTNAQNPVIIGVNKSTSSFIAIVRNTASARKLFVSSQLKTVSDIEQVTFSTPDPAAFNYLIISHAQLRTGDDPVARYADYRSSEAGGGYSVQIADIDELFNQFSFGDPSPLAIRRYCDRMLDGGDPQYLFIIGKGLTPASDYYRNASTTDVINFVPTYGHPGTDAPFTAGLGDAGIESAIPTGRINAFNTGQVNAYLDKVIEMEAVPFDQFWRKNTLLLSGGQTPNEQRSFRNFIEQFDEVLSGTFLGGTSALFSKERSESVTFIDVVEEINEGVSLVTFFGHSSAFTSDIDVGLVSNPETGYLNKGRYPVFLINGCNAGNFFSPETATAPRIFGDDWILARDLGAIGFVASSSFALSTNLKRYSDLFLDFGYSNNEFFGEGIGDILQRTGREYIRLYGQSVTSTAQVQQFALNGDPAVALYGTSKPDYDIDEEDVSFVPFEGDLILASTDSFNIQIAVKNFGRLVNEQVKVAVLRTLADGSVINYETQVFPSVNTQDTLNFKVRRNPEIDETGTSRFEILIDPQNETDEILEDNNSVSLTLDIFSGTTSNLYPLDFGIVPESNIELIYQLSDLTSSQSRSVLLELDTVATFDSPWKRNNLIATELLGRWPVDLNFAGLADGQVFYWRTKLQNPGPTEQDEWVTTSFSYIAGSPGGWRQASAAQLQQTIQEGVSLDETKQWGFEIETTAISIQTHGADNASLDKDNVRVLVGGSNILQQNIEATSRFPDCAENTMNVIVFDRRSAFPYTPVFIDGDETEQRLVCGRRPQFVYNLLEQDITGEDINGNPVPTLLDSIINESELGDMVLLFNIERVSFSKWPVAIINQLSEIGVDPASIAGLTDGQPVIILGKKGDAPGSALILDQNGTGQPVLEQALDLAANVEGSNGEGVVQSIRIGPSDSWLNFSQTIDVLNGEDEFATSIYGLQDGTRQLLVSDVSDAQLDLSATNANDFQFLELEWTFSDQARQTPAQLQNWQVTFEQLPDGLLIDPNEVVSLQEGAVYQPEFGFYNYTNATFSDSLEIAYSILNRESRSFFVDTLKIASPAVGDTVNFSPAFSTVGFVGTNDISIRVNVNDVPEQYAANNLISRSAILEVEADEVNPILDVTFDGRYIRNGEIISPNPSISIRLRDESPFFFKSESVGVFLFLMQPCEGCDFEQVFVSDENISWSPATATSDFKVVYQPKDLESGFYGFRTQAQDASGNDAGQEPYEVEFNVATEASITDFVPFPNPFRDGVSFSFTLTGTTPPEAMTIQIFTLTGQLLRSIDLDELGTLNIGPNVTEAVWDGTDSQGQSVRNGIYLYRVQLTRGGEVVKGEFFENGIGRLFLLR
mgnify:CR=1 FL=1